MLKKIVLFLLMASSLVAQKTSIDTEISIPPVAMSQDYSNTTQTIKVSLNSFKSWVIEAIETNQNELEEVIREQGFLVISDIGCFDGGNFFEPLKEVITKIRELYGHDFQVRVVYSDLNKTPGGFTKQLLSTPELLGKNVKTAYFEHNFYLPLPYVSNITICTLGTHWLSISPHSSIHLNSIFPTCYIPGTPEHEKVSQIANTDLNTFFQARLKDTNVILGLVNMIKIKSNKNKVTFTAQATMGFMDKIIANDVDKVIAECNNSIIPFYYRFSEEFLNIAKECGYQIDRAQDFIFPCEYVKLYDQRKITRQQLIDAETKMARAWSEGSILQIVGKNHIENFYKNLQRYFEEAPDLYGSDYHLQFMMLYPPHVSTPL